MCFLSPFFTLTLIICTKLLTTTGYELDLYPYTYEYLIFGGSLQEELHVLANNGSTISIDNSSCINLPEQLAGKAQSIKVYNCTQFYEKPDCMGISIQLSNNSPHQGNLKMWNFHNRIMSARACQDSCIPEMGQDSLSNKTVSINLYTLPFFQGKPRHVEVKGCTFLSDSFNFEPTVKSVFVPKGTCVLAFTYRYNVSNTSKDCVIKNEEESKKVIEIRDGMPQLYYLDRWPPYSYYSQGVTAFSPCICTSFTSSKTLGMVDLLPDENYTVLFSEQRFQGSQLKITFNSTSDEDCVNVDPKFATKVYSIGTTHECLKLFDKLSCTGSYLRLSLSTPFRDDLKMWGLHNRIFSIKMCNDSCVPNVEQAVSFFNQDHFVSIKITYYLEAFWKGKEHILQIRGCTHTGIKMFREDVIGSVKIPKGHCILAYFRNYSIYDYSDTQSKPYCSVVDNENVVELWDGHPGLGGLKALGNLKWHEYIIAFSPCYCNDFPNVISSEKNIVKLYSDINLKGSSVTIALNFTGCNNFATNDKLTNWEGRARSMYLSDGSCVKAHTDQHCSDGSHVTLNSSVYDLSVIELDSVIRSLSGCNQPNSSPVGSGVAVYLIPIGCIIILVAVALGIYLIYVRYRIKRKIREILSDKEIDEFLEGFRIGMEENPERNIIGLDQENIDDTGIQLPPTDVGTELLAQSQPYNYELEVSRSQLEFDGNCPIGEGHYGRVFKGTLRVGNDVVSVAVKTTKPFSEVNSLRALLKEVKILMFVGQHPKIVTLIGCCTENLRRGELLIAMEFCENGSLEKYLQSNRNNFETDISTKHQDAPQSAQYSQLLPQSGSDGVQYVDMTASPVFPLCKTRTLKTNQLFKWCIEIAEGMEYLASKKVIHGDLSARNILLVADKTAKISDFGLARKLYAYEQYIKNGDDALPWRWLALEALKKMEFSTASDIWSYGILMWEIFSLGEKPYPGVPLWTNNFIISLEQGLRPTIPKFAAFDCYTIMMRCWSKIPQERPSFSLLMSNLHEVVKDKPNYKMCESGN